MTNPTQDMEKTNVAKSVSRRLSVGELIAWLTVGWFIIALFLEWGYWRGFGIAFEEIPLSVQYFLETVLVWLPGLLLSIFAVFAYELLVWRELGDAYGMSDDLPPLRKPRGNEMLLPWWKRWHILRPTVWGPWFVVLGTPFIIWKSGEIHFILLIPFVLFGWSIVMRILLNHTPLKIFKEMPFANFIFALPGIAAILFCIGYWVALDDSKNAAKTATVYFTKNAHIQKKELLILRNTGEFIIAFDGHMRKISVIPHDAVHELSFHSDPNWIIKFFKSGQNQESEVPIRPLPRAPTPRH